MPLWRTVYPVFPTLEKPLFLPFANDLQNIYRHHFRIQPYVAWHSVQAFIAPAEDMLRPSLKPIVRGSYARAEQLPLRERLTFMQTVNRGSGMTDGSNSGKI